jgi:hypothetical protein
MNILIYVNAAANRKIPAQTSFFEANRKKSDRRRAEAKDSAPESSFLFWCS